MELQGLRVVLTRPASGSSPWTELLVEEGASVISCPTIKIAPPESWGPLDEAISGLRTYDWVAFNSVNAVDAFAGRARLLGENVLKTIPKVAAVGGVTSARLESLGIPVHLVPEEKNAVALALSLGVGDGRRVLIPRAADVPPGMKEVLSGAGWFVREVPAYRTVTADRGPGAQEVESAAFDVVVFASGSAVRGFVDLFGAGVVKPPDKRIVSIGPVTSATVRSAGLQVDAEAEDQSGEGLVAAILSMEGLKK
jgi:uroporphyrinogen III methyltransferase/synthase